MSDSRTSPTLNLELIRAAAERIAPYIRRTPMIEVTQVRNPPTSNPLFLKLESLQVTGAFKARGGINRLLMADPASLKNGIVTASGGNHGLAVARAGAINDIPVTVYLPSNASRAKIRALADWNAMVKMAGDRWDDADREATAHAEREGAVYFHPFKDVDVIAGHGSVAIEMLEQCPHADVFLVAIGGGGLAASMATVIKALKPQARIIGIEPTGSPTLHDSLAAGDVVTLEKVTTRVATMSCGRTSEMVYDIIAKGLDEVVLVEDEDMVTAARWIWQEFSIRADLSAAAAIAALCKGKIALQPHETVCTLICGADDAAVQVDY